MDYRDRETPLQEIADFCRFLVPVLKDDQHEHLARMLEKLLFDLHCFDEAWNQQPTEMKLKKP